MSGSKAQRQAPVEAAGRDVSKPPVGQPRSNRGIIHHFLRGMVLDPKGSMQLDRLRRRGFIVQLGGAVAWPFAACAG
jgi:hypothetical protein